MKVIIMYRGTYFKDDDWSAYPLPVEIKDTCAYCGDPRGEPEPYTFTEDGESHTVDRWENPCGHIDTYKGCYLEHLLIQKEKKHETEVF